MIVALLSALSSLSAANDCIERTCVVSGNHAADLLGEPDTRQGTWGKAGFIEMPITFRPPPGHRVNILRITGDLVAWPTRRGTLPAFVPWGRYAGVLWGMKTTGPDGSIHADWAADNTMLYVQTGTRGEVARAPASPDLGDGVLLEDDHILRSILSVWLNDTGLKIHMEATYTIAFRFEQTQPKENPTQ